MKMMETMQLARHLLQVSLQVRPTNDANPPQRKRQEDRAPRNQIVTTQKTTFLTMKTSRTRTIMTPAWTRRMQVELDQSPTLDHSASRDIRTTILNSKQDLSTHSILRRPLPGQHSAVVPRHFRNTRPPHSSAQYGTTSSSWASNPPCLHRLRAPAIPTRLHQTTESLLSPPTTIADRQVPTMTHEPTRMAPHRIATTHHGPEVLLKQAFLMIPSSTPNSRATRPSAGCQQQPTHCPVIQVQAATHPSISFLLDRLERCRTRCIATRRSHAIDRSGYHRGRQ